MILKEIIEVRGLVAFIVSFLKFFLKYFMWIINLFNFCNKFMKGGYYFKFFFIVKEIER